MSDVVRSDRYTTGAIWFHWIIAILVILNLVIGLFHESLLHGWHNAIPVHKAVGITVLVLSIARIAWRLAHPAPPFSADMAGWERRLAKTVRTIFYFLLILMPASGWIMVSASTHPHPMTWFGLFPIPLLPVAHGAGAPADVTHMVLGYLFAVLVVLHIAGALRHQFVLRDGVLARMFPAAASRG